MAEPVSLTLGAVVAALVVEAAKKAGGAAVEAGAGVLGRLVTAVRDRFTASDDTDGQAALARVEDPPVGDAQLAKLAAAIDAQAADEAWARQLQQLVDDAGADSTVDVKRVVQQIYGDRNIAVADVSNSQISINQPPTTG